MIHYHIEGGVEYMVPLSLIFFVNIGLIVLVLVRTIQRKDGSARLLEMIRQTGGLALAWGVLSTVIGLFQAFGALSELKETLPFETIMGGLKVALITAVYGLIIFVISSSASIGLKMLEKRS